MIYSLIYAYSFISNFFFFVLVCIKACCSDSERKMVIDRCSRVLRTHEGEEKSIWKAYEMTE